ncbi:MAG: UvrD-helicase domain-containing protein, partial [Octadecabacter sp.]|nr:UvrD-helicase domain-containing protein [Octadecabacter sp.]
MIPNDATARQVESADPARSTWLSANAGSGKTRVLTDRVARLLLAKTRPENILCLTYTKAAASEMQNRLFKRLGEWAMMPTAKLRRDLTDLGIVETIDDAYLREARTLFAAAIEAPGGLKIQTIHSFCADILRRFPLEAAVSPQFKEMEDRAAEILRDEVLNEMAQEDPDALALFARHYTGAELPKFLAGIAGKKAAFLSPPSPDALSDLFDVPANLTYDNLIAAIASPDDLETIRKLIPVCAASGSNDQKAAAKLQTINTGTAPTMADIEVMEDVFLFGGSAKNPFGAKIDIFPTKAVRQANPELVDDLNDLMQRVEDGRDERLRWLALEKTRALFTF